MIMVDAKIPEWIPTWVTPAPEVAQNPYNLVTDKPTVSTPSVPGEWGLDKMIKSIARFFAKLGGLPDPITGAVSPSVATSPANQTKENFVNKMWSKANTAVEKVATVTTQTVNTVKDGVDAAVTEVKNVQEKIVGQTADTQPEKSADTQSLDSLWSPH